MPPVVRARSPHVSDHAVQASVLAQKIYEDERRKREERKRKREEEENWQKQGAIPLFANQLPRPPANRLRSSRSPGGGEEATGGRREGVARGQPRALPSIQRPAGHLAGVGGRSCHRK